MIPFGQVDLICVENEEYFVERLAGMPLSETFQELFQGKPRGLTVLSTLNEGRQAIPRLVDQVPVFSEQRGNEKCLELGPRGRLIPRSDAFLEEYGFGNLALR